MQEQRAFTLIELLVVIAIIGILSSVVLASLNSARTRASDTRAKADLRNIQSALHLYYDQYKTMPPNRTSGSYPSTNADWLSELVDAGYLAAKPTPPSGYVYRYYTYGSGSVMGAILKTELKGIAATSEAPAGSCRPFSGSNWCRSDIPSVDYCVCTPY